MSRQSTKICRQCNQFKPIEAFGTYNNPLRKTLQIASKCKPCRKLHLASLYASKTAAEKTRYNGYHKAKELLAKRYGMTTQQYDALFKQQNYLCAICNKPETASRNGKLRLLCVDHCHTTGLVRGLLCHRCNTGIGYLNDDPEILKSAAQYLTASTLSQR